MVLLKNKEINCQEMKEVSGIKFEKHPFKGAAPLILPTRGLSI